MKKKEIIEVEIKGLEFPAKGISELEGKKVYIKNTIPGQVVRAAIKKIRKDYVEAKLVEVVKHSVMEDESFCEHFGKCGGCSYQTIPYEKQLTLKEDLVKGLLDEAGIKGYEFLNIEPSKEPFQYRNKMEYSFGNESKGGELTLGMHKKGRFYDVVTVDKCQIIDEDFNRILRTILEYFRKKEVSYYNNRRHEGYLRHLVVRKAKKTQEMLINLVTTTQQNLDLTDLVEAIKTIELDGKVIGFLHTFNDNVADTVTSDETRILFGEDHFTEELLGLKFRISAFSFFQTNSVGAEQLYSMVLDFMGDADQKTVFDLYCGTGTIGQIVAKKAKKVLGIELVEEAVKAANENSKLNGLSNCTFIAGDVLKKIDEFTTKPDIIILDPPRAGVHPKALKKILNYRAPEIIYVSCNPKSLAENLKDIQKSGYKVEKVQCMDMFPHTPHVETVVRIVRK